MTLWSLFCRSSGLALIFRQSAFFNPEEMGAWDRGDERAVDVVQGSFFLIRRALWERLGGFDLAFVMYGEEQDLCRRAAALGARPRMTPEATIVHYHGASSRRAAREIMTLKARVTLIRRHFPAWQQPIGLFLLGFWPWSRMVSGGALSRLSGRPRFAEAAAMWGDVWRARGEWLRGYPAAALSRQPVEEAPVLRRAAPRRRRGSRPGSPPRTSRRGRRRPGSARARARAGAGPAPGRGPVEVPCPAGDRRAEAGVGGGAGLERREAAVDAEDRVEDDAEARRPRRGEERVGRPARASPPAPRRRGRRWRSRRGRPRRRPPPPRRGPCRRRGCPRGRGRPRRSAPRAATPWRA